MQRDKVLAILAQHQDSLKRFRVTKILYSREARPATRFASIHSLGLSLTYAHFGAYFNP